MLVMRQHAERLLYGDMLDRDGFETRRCGSLSVARAELTGGSPQIIMVELDDGFAEALDFIRWVKATNPGAAVIAISAFPEADDSARQAGADHCIQLPVPMHQMVQAVNQLVR